MSIDKKKIEAFSGLVVLILIAGAIAWFYQPKLIDNGLNNKGQPISESDIEEGIILSKGSSVPPPGTYYSTLTLAKIKNGDLRGYFENSHAVGTRKNFKMVSDNKNVNISPIDFKKIMIEVQKLKQGNGPSCVGSVTSVKVYIGAKVVFRTDTCSDHVGVDSFSELVSKSIMIK